MTSNNDDKRRSPRKSVRYRAVAYSGDTGVFCDIIDISATGCQIMGPKVPKLPDEIRLHKIGTPDFRPAWIRWRDGFRAGVSFSEPN